MRMKNVIDVGKVVLNVRVQSCALNVRKDIIWIYIMFVWNVKTVWNANSKKTNSIVYNVHRNII